MPGPWRSYTEQERAAAVGRALAIGTKRAAVELGIPRRTLSSWLHRPTAPIQAAIVSSADAIEASLETAATEGSAWLLNVIRDPKTPTRVRVDAIELALQQWTLASGRATARTESTVTTGQELSWEDRDKLRDFLDAIEAASDDELRTWAADGGLAQMRTAEHDATRLLESGDAS